MAGPVHCRCGALLVDQVTEEGVTPLGGEPLRFRRTTDYVICPECFSVYRARVLLGEESVEESFVEKLERMVEETRPEE